MIFFFFNEYVKLKFNIKMSHEFNKIPFKFFPIILPLFF